MTTTNRIDALTARYTAYDTLTDLIHAMARGYSPSIRSAELADVVDEMAAAYGLRTRCFRPAVRRPTKAQRENAAICAWIYGEAQ